MARRTLDAVGRSREPLSSPRRLRDYGNDAQA